MGSPSTDDQKLPSGHFDGVFVSNFLEHLFTQEDVAPFLERMHAVMKPGGRIAIMGPNYRYCAKEYWDCADHYLALRSASMIFDVTVVTYQRSSASG